MTSQGQRFRRRALRRGYKVDEVDSFLDKVEATLAGEQVGPPITAQEVHDVVFRVRFGGYDEWQVDLHLDRVERQLAELEERGGRPAAPDSMRDSMRGGLSPAGGPPPGAPAGMGAPGMGGAGMGSGGMGPGPMGPGPMGGGMPAPGMGPGPNRMAPPTERLPAPVRDDRMSPPQMPQRSQMPPPDPYGRYEEPGYGQPQQPQPQLPQRGQGGYDQGGYDPGYDQGGYDPGYDQGGFDGFEAGRHGKSDMTAEIRMPDRDPRGGGYGPPPMGGGPQMPPPNPQMPPAGMPPGPPMPHSPMPHSPMPHGQMPGAPMSGPPTGGGYGNQPHLGPMLGEPGGELYRVDQLRRTFQPRRFGSGYDPMQVDRLFEQILQAMTGRGPMPVNENDLDMLQFGLVPNGYFEAEVDAALREVKDILLRRR